MRSWILGLLVCAALMTGVAAGEKKQGEWVIGLSNSYYGNTWRKQMVDTFVDAAEQAKKEGLIKDYIVMNGDGTQNQQISQMNSLILQQVDAICINAFSPTAMNGVIDKAAKAGIKVLAFDSIATSPNCWTMDFDFVKQGEDLTQYIVDRLGGKGNVIMVRGISGSAPELAIYQGQMNVLAKNPGINVLTTVFGEASDTVAQKAVANILPSMPHIDAVLNQGGDGYGTAMAFADAGRPTPIIIGGNRAEFIHWWLKEKQANGYETISIGSTPGIGGAALWTAVNILQGNPVPKKMSLPCYPVTQDTVDQYADMKPGTVISPVFTNEFVVETIIKPHLAKEAESR